MLEVSLVDAPAVETEGFFFKRLGEIIFSPTSDQSFPIRCTTLAVAPHSGIICFSDAGGLYIAYTQDLLKKLTKWDSDNPQPPTPPASICKSVLFHTNATIHLSPDESQLAVIDNHNNTVSFYSLPSLIHGKAIKACISTHTLPTHTTQLAWSPISMGTYALLTDNGQVYVGNTITGGGKAAGPSVFIHIETATCIAFNPISNSSNSENDDVILAVGHSDVVSFYKIQEDTNNNKTKEAVSQIKLSSQEVQEDNQHLVVESMQWLDGSHILIGCTLLFDGTVEPVAPEGVLSWNPGRTIPLSSSEGNDDVKYVEFFASNIVPPPLDGQDNNNNNTSAPYLQSTSLPQWSCIVYSNRQAADDHIKVAKYHSDGGDVVAVDITDDRLAIRIPNAPDDEDNYVIGLGIDCTSVDWPVVEHPTDQTAPDLPPQPVLFVATSDGVLRAYTFGCVDSKDGVGVGVGVRKDLRLLEEEEEEEEEVEDKAAKTGLPSDSEDFSEEEDEEEVEEKEKAKVVPPSVTFAPPPTATTVKPQEPPPQQPIFSFAAPPLPPPSPTTTTQAPVEPKQEIKPTTEDKIKPPPSPTLPTIVDLPAPKLTATTDSKEAVEIEADFLKTLYTTRKLEAEVHDALVATLNGPATDKGTRATHHSSVLSQLSSLNNINAALLSTNDLRGGVTKLATDIKDALRRCEAMPLFQSAASISGLEEEREQHRELMLKQPLNSSLSGLKDAIRCKLVAYKAKVTELSSCLDSLEAHQRQQKQQMMMTQGGSAFQQQQQPTAQALYTSVNALGAAVQSTLHHLTALSEELMISDSNDGCSVGDHDLSGAVSAMGLHSSEREKPSPSPSSSPHPQQLVSALQSLSVTDSGRRNWQLVRKSPMSRNDNTNTNTNTNTGDYQHLRPSVSPMHQTRAATSPQHDGGGRGGDIWEGGEGDALRRRILEACQPLGLMVSNSTNSTTSTTSVNGVRVTSVASNSRGRGGGIGGGWSSRRLLVEKLGGRGTVVEPVELPIPNTRTTAAAAAAAVERSEEVRSSSSSSSSSTAKMTSVASMQVPPVPMSKPKAAQKPSQAQPPIPSMKQVKAASKLMEKASAAAAPKPPPPPPAAAAAAAAAPSPPIPSNAAAQAAQARFEAFQKDVSPTENKSDEPSKEKKESAQQPLFSAAPLPSSTIGGFNFSGLGLGGSSGTGTADASKPSSGFGFALAPSSAAAASKQGVFASPAPAFGASASTFGASSAAAFGASAPAFGASSAAAFGASTPAFGASSTSAFGATTTTDSTGSPFGQAASPISSSLSPAFGSSATFGSSQPASSAFGSATGFGAPSPFGAQPPASSSPAFGSSTTFGSGSTGFGASTTFGQGAATPGFGATTPFGQQQQQQTGSAFGGGGGSSPFGQAAAPGGGFGAFGGGSSGGGGGFGGIKPAAGTASSTGAGNASLWQPRK